jgi:hypothetical protein
MGVTAIAKKLGWHRTTFVRDVLAKWSFEEGGVRKEISDPPKVDPPPPPKVEPPPKEAIRPRAVGILPDWANAQERIKLPFRTPLGKLVDETKGGVAIWHTANGHMVEVQVDPNTSRTDQIVIRDAIAGVPSQFFRSAGRKGAFPIVQVKNDLISAAYGNQKTDGWSAAGQFSVVQNHIRISTKTQNRAYYKHVLLHEIGHGLHYNSRAYGPNKEFRRAFRADRKEIVAGKKGCFSNDYKEFAYYRAVWKEAFAESTAVLTSDFQPERSARFLRAFPRSAQIVRGALEKILARKA